MAKRAKKQIRKEMSKIDEEWSKKYRELTNERIRKNRKVENEYYNKQKIAYEIIKKKLEKLEKELKS